MDIASIKPLDRTIEILHPGTDEPIGVSVTIMSVTDKRMEKIRRNITDRRLKLDAKGSNFKADELEDNRSNLAFAAMVDWDWHGDDANFNGSKPEFNRKNVLAVFDAAPWFRDQIDRAIAEEKDFFAPPKSS